MFTKSPDLWLSLRNNFIYLAVHMVMIPIELGIAVMLNSGLRGAKPGKDHRVSSVYHQRRECPMRFPTFFSR